jgi:hypothetical protein
MGTFWSGSSRFQSSIVQKQFVRITVWQADRSVFDRVTEMNHRRRSASAILFGPESRSGIAGTSRHTLLTYIGQIDHISGRREE